MILVVPEFEYEPRPPNGSVIIDEGPKKEVRPTGISVVIQNPATCVCEPGEAGQKVRVLRHS